MVLCISKLDKLFECVNTITMLVVKLSANGHRMGSSAAHIYASRYFFSPT